MPTTETLLQSPTIDLIDDADLLWVWNSSASALTKATRASVVGDIDLLFSNGSDKQISINNSPAATVGRQLTVQAGNVASGTNLNGGGLSLSAGLGTGTGNSNLIFSTGESTGSATSVQTLTERMRITNSGNVGIGTTSPNSKIDVNGGATIGVGLASGDPGFSPSAGELTIGEARGNGSAGINTRLTLINGAATAAENGNAIDFATSTNANVSSIKSRISGFGNSANDKGFLAFSTFNGTSVNEQVRINDLGNVGIGTTSPNSKIDINGGATIGVGLASGDPGFSPSAGELTIGEARGNGSAGINTRLTLINGAATAAENGNAIDFATSTNANVSSIKSRISGFGNSANDKGFLAFSTFNGTSVNEQVRINDLGSVGIGTTSPSTRLDIDAGALELAEMTAPGAGAVNTVRIYAVDNGAGKTQLMAIFNTGAAQQLAIQP